MAPLEEMKQLLAQILDRADKSNASLAEIADNLPKDSARRSDVQPMGGTPPPLPKRFPDSSSDSISKLTSLPREISRAFSDVLHGRFTSALERLPAGIHRSLSAKGALTSGDVRSATMKGQFQGTVVAKGAESVGRVAAKTAGKVAEWSMPKTLAEMFGGLEDDSKGTKPSSGLSPEAVAAVRGVDLSKLAELGKSTVAKPAVGMPQLAPNASIREKTNPGKTEHEKKLDASMGRLVGALQQLTSGVLKLNLRGRAITAGEGLLTKIGNSRVGGLVESGLNKTFGPGTAKRFIVPEVVKEIANQVPSQKSALPGFTNIPASRLASRVGNAGVNAVRATGTTGTATAGEGVLGASEVVKGVSKTGVGVVVGKNAARVAGKAVVGTGTAITGKAVVGTATAVGATGIGLIVLAVVAAFAILTVAIYKISKAIVSWGESLYEGQRKIKDFNGQIAYAFARSTVSQMKRDISYGAATASTTDALGKSLDSLYDAVAPIKSFLYNTIGTYLSTMIGMFAIFIDIALKIAGKTFFLAKYVGSWGGLMLTLLEKIGNKDAKNEGGALFPVSQFLSDVAQGRFDIHRDPLFSW